AERDAPGDVELGTLDARLAVEADGLLLVHAVSASTGQFGLDRDRLGDAVEGQVPSDVGFVVIGQFDRRRNETRGGGARTEEVRGAAVLSGPQQVVLQSGARDNDRSDR